MHQVHRIDASLAERGAPMEMWSCHTSGFSDPSENLTGSQFLTLLNQNSREMAVLCEESEAMIDNDTTAGKVEFPCQHDGSVGRHLNRSSHAPPKVDPSVGVSLDSVEDSASPKACGQSPRYGPEKRPHEFPSGDTAQDGLDENGLLLDPFLVLLGGSDHPRGHLQLLDSELARAERKAKVQRADIPLAIFRHDANPMHSCRCLEIDTDEGHPGPSLLPREELQRVALERCLDR